MKKKENKRGFYINSLEEVVRLIENKKISVKEVGCAISGRTFKNKKQIREAYSLIWEKKKVRIAEKLWKKGKIHPLNYLYK